jgi:hypothetical protein
MTTSTSILTLASEIYSSNCKQDPEFNSLSSESIAAAVRVDLSDKLGRKLTDVEEDMVDEALLLFGVGEKPKPSVKLTKKQAYVMACLKHQGGKMEVEVGPLSGFHFSTLNSLKNKGLIELYKGAYKMWKIKKLG